MKKLVVLLSFVFVLGLVAVNAQTPVKKEVKKAPAKTEQTAVKPAVAPAAKPAVKAKKTKKVVAPAKK